MTLRVLGRAWDPDSPSNADWLFTEASTVVLLDGAAPRGSERVSDYSNDTVWLVRRFVDEFAAAGSVRGAAPGSVRQRVEAARAALSREYAGLSAARGGAPNELPFACLAIAHHAGDVLELYNMGDLTALVRGRDGSVQRFGESFVRELDRRALDELGRLLAAGVEPHAERRERVGALVLAHRALRNQPSGYDVLDLEAGGAERLEQRAFEAGGVRDLLMMSDGFYRLVDTFERYTDETLLEAVERVGLEALLGELRSLERADAECTRYLRFKTHDDATALWLGVA